MTNCMRWRYRIDETKEIIWTNSKHSTLYRRLNYQYFTLISIEQQKFHSYKVKVALLRSHCNNFECNQNNHTKKSKFQNVQSTVQLLRHGFQLANISPLIWGCKSQRYLELGALQFLLTLQQLLHWHKIK